MKLKFFITLPLLLALSVSVAGAQVRQEVRYSTAWQPISGAEVQNKVRQNASQAVALHQLWWRAQLQGVMWYYVLALREVTQKQPDNAVALSAYCATLLDCLKYEKIPSYKKAKANLGQDLEPVGIRHLLERAKKIDAKQWLIWMSEADMVRFEGGDMTTMGSRMEQFARRAVQLSDNSFTNAKLAYSLRSRADWDRKKLFIDQAITVCRRAQNLAPRHMGASVLLLLLFRNEKKNQIEAEKAEKAILATIPPGIELSTASRNYLKQIDVDLP